MADEQRDRNFEKALARHMSTAGGASPLAAGHDAACPDAETLAAYHERMLSPEELNTYKQHIAGCAHCQEILAQLELTEQIPLEQVPQELVAAAPGQAKSWVASAQVTTGANVPLQMPKPTASRSTRAAHWRWIAPTGAIAAGLLVWVAIHQYKAQRVETTAPVQIAMNRETAEPPASKKESPAPPSRVALGDAEKSLELGQQSPSAKQVLIAPRIPRRDSGATTVQVQQAPEIAQDAVSPESAKVDGALEQKDVKSLPMNGRNYVDLAQLTPGGASAGAAVAAPAPQRAKPAAANGPAPPSPQQQQNANQVVVVNEAPPVSTSETVTVVTDSAAVSSELETNSGFQPTGSVSMAKAAKMRSSQMIVAITGHAIWRTGKAGMLEHSADGGTTWTAQSSGVSVDLLAGSAPNPAVCWVVGRQGMVIRTVDGGAHWNKLTSPIADDLGGVHATDATHAVIWDVPGKRTFGTSDGGVTWTPSQHNKAE